MGDNLSPLYTNSDDCRLSAHKSEDRFNLEIDGVGAQYRDLLDLLNELGAQLLKLELKAEERQSYLRKVVAYSHFHFTNEERFMEEAGLDIEFINNHKQLHQQFVSQLETLLPEIQHDPDEASGLLLKSLFHWLILHIMRSNEATQFQITLIKQGISPCEASTKAQQARKADQVGPLLLGMESLFNLLAKRNRDLRDLNAAVEQRVAQRTLELLKANESLVTLAQTDVLTNLPNRRHALQMLEIMWREAMASGRAMCCLMIDADNFKDVNDLHGHAAGDTVLQTLATTLRNSVRTDDIVARFGGDEFCVLCPHTTLEGGLQLAALLLDEVVGLNMKTWRSTVSIGVACSLFGVENGDELIRIADESLYIAKDSGRSCIRSLQGVVSK